MVRLMELVVQFYENCHHTFFFVVIKVLVSEQLQEEDLIVS